jgi:hypothetical protein
MAIDCTMLILGRTGKNCPGYAFSISVWLEFHSPLSSKHGSDAWQPSVIYRDAIKQTVSCPLTEHTTRKKVFPLGLLKTWMRIIAVVMTDFVAERNTNDVSWCILAARWITVIAMHIPYPNWKQYIASTRPHPRNTFCELKAKVVCFFLIAEWLAYLYAYPRLRRDAKPLKCGNRYQTVTGVKIQWLCVPQFSAT